MSIPGILTGGLASILSGGALGVLGAVGNGVLDYFKTKEKNKHELAVISAQKELALVNKDSAIILETIKLSAASYENDKEAYVNTKLFSVDGYRGTLRPNVCYFLLITATYLTWWCVKKTGLNPEVMAEIAIYGTYTCMNLAATTVSWYFGTRQMDKLTRRK